MNPTLGSGSPTVFPSTWPIVSWRLQSHGFVDPLAFNAPIISGPDQGFSIGTDSNMGNEDNLSSAFPGPSSGPLAFGADYFPTSLGPTLLQQDPN